MAAKKNNKKKKAAASAAQTSNPKTTASSDPKAAANGVPAVSTTTGTTSSTSSSSNQIPSSDFAFRMDGGGAATSASSSSLKEKEMNGNGNGEKNGGPSSPKRVKKSPSPRPELSSDPKVRGEQLKEEGNEAFRAGLFGLAIDRYSEAIAADPSEPTYLTNRAASYMAEKRFQPAVADCQTAASLQSANPSPKTLLRLARCHLALGSPEPALSAIRQVLEIEPRNANALQMKTKAAELEAHLGRFHKTRAAKDWRAARVALDKCFQAIEGGDADAPSEWLSWRLQLEIARGNWDDASTVANNALRTDSNSADIIALRGLILFLTGKLPGALQHALAALQKDPDNDRAKALRKRVKAVERLKEEGNVAFKGSRWGEAVGKYTEALEVIGENEEEGKGGYIRATLLSNRATALLKEDRHADALLDTDASIALNDSSYKAFRTRARIQLHLEKYDAAISDFNRALELVGIDATTEERALKTELRKAEAALKRSKSKDYYKILGVERDCGEVEIKKAYRRESLKHHPDKGGDEEKFKLVVEAHGVLSDPQRRERYDLGGDDNDDLMGSGGMGGFGGMGPDFADIFMQFGGMGGMGGGRRGSGGGGGFSFSSEGPGHFHF